MTSLAQRQQKLDNLKKLLDANSFERVLDRGFALVTNNYGAPIKRAVDAPTNAAVMIRFSDGGRGALLDADAENTDTTKRSVKQPKKTHKSAFDDGQDQLF